MPARRHMFWGSHYSRTWFTTLAVLPLLCGVYFSILGGTRAWVPLLALAAVCVVVLWAIPQSVVDADGVRLVLRRELVAWSDVDAVLDPHQGDEEIHVQLTSGRIIALPGVPPSAATELRALWNART